MPGGTYKMAEGVLPTRGKFWNLYWTSEILTKICCQTNLYAKQQVGKLEPSLCRKTKGGQGWVRLTVPELEAWIEILIIMGIKKKPQICSYWQSSEEILRDPIISRVMSLH
jgi:hypothetical protein